MGCILFPDQMDGTKFSIDDIEGYYRITQNGKLHIHFCGANTLRDYLRVLFSSRSKDINRVNEQLSNALSAVLARHVDLLLPDRQVIITGHSLGGILAYLYASRLRAVSNVATEIITFGTPHLAFARKTYDVINDWLFPFEAKHYRMAWDWIPFVGPKVYHTYKIKARWRWNALWFNHQPIQYATMNETRTELNETLR
jgi:alpha-beta hydrolase superfamily lysophospholipase